MKLQFAPNQSFQLDAVAAVTELFDGQPQGAPEFAVIKIGGMGGLFAGQDRTELGIGNRQIYGGLVGWTFARSSIGDVQVARARLEQVHRSIAARDWRRISCDTDGAPVSAACAGSDIGTRKGARGAKTALV